MVRDVGGDWYYNLDMILFSGVKGFGEFKYSSRDADKIRRVLHVCVPRTDVCDDAVICTCCGRQTNAVT